MAHGDVPNCNHFVLTSSVGPAAGDVPVANVADAKHALTDRQALDHTIASKAEVSVFYAALGRSVHFPVAQGDCGPDTTALSHGLASTPSSWKSIRLGVAEYVWLAEHRVVQAVLQGVSGV